MTRLELDEQRQAEVERLEELVLAKMRAEARKMAELLASKPNQELFGATEFALRDVCLEFGCGMLEAALEERKKRGIKDPV